MVHSCSNLVQIDHESSCGKHHRTNSLLCLDTEFLFWRASCGDDGKDGSILANIVGIDHSSIGCSDRHIGQSSSWHRNYSCSNHTAICLRIVDRVVVGPPAAAREGELGVARVSCPPSSPLAYHGHFAFQTLICLVCVIVDSASG